MVIKKKVLIVDDEVDFLEMLKIRLEANNYEVITAANGEDALDKVKSQKPDAVLLDIMMPEVDGYRVKARLAEDRQTAGIPVIFLTAKGFISDKVAGLSLGVDDYIVKPFEPEELLARIATAINRRS